MPIRKTTRTDIPAGKIPTSGPLITENVVKEIVATMLHEGFSQQARDLEKHLKDIHERIVKLENVLHTRR